MEVSMATSPRVGGLRNANTPRTGNRRVGFNTHNIQQHYTPSHAPSEVMRAHPPQQIPLKFSSSPIPSPVSSIPSSIFTSSSPLNTASSSSSLYPPVPQSSYVPPTQSLYQSSPMSFAHSAQYTPQPATFGSPLRPSVHTSYTPLPINPQTPYGGGGTMNGGMNGNGYHSPVMNGGRPVIGGFAPTPVLPLNPIPAPAIAAPASTHTTNALAAADDLVCASINADRAGVEIAVIGNSSTYSYTYNEREPPRFVFQRKIDLPPAIPDAMRGAKEGTTKMGYFEEISRVWAIAQTQLFLWQFDGEDFCVYEGQDTPLKCVGIVPPKPNLLVDEIRHVMVIVSERDIAVVAVVFGADPTVPDSLSLRPLSVNIPTDGTIFNKVQGTRDGRVFLTADDGCLYEIKYALDPGWFNKKTWEKRNYTRGNVLSSMFSFGGNDKLIDSVLDSERELLYTLSQSGVITMYTLGQNSIQLVHTLTDPIGRAIDKMPGAATDSFRRNNRLKRIFVLRRNESTQFILEAVSSAGLRLYFGYSGSQYYYQQNRQPTNLILAHVRGPSIGAAPLAMPLPTYQQPYGPRVLAPQYNYGDPYMNGAPPPGPMYPEALQVQDAYYYQGITLMLLNDYRLEVSVADYKALQSFSPHERAAETVAHVRLTAEELILSISEVPLSASLLQPKTVGAHPLGYHSDPYFEAEQTGPDAFQEAFSLTNELAGQHLLPSRTFLLLSAQCVYLYQKEPPIDTLARAIETGDQATQVQIMKQYSRPQAYAMYLALATGYPREIWACNLGALGMATQVYQNGDEARYIEETEDDSGSVVRAVDPATGQPLDTDQPVRRFEHSDGQQAFVIYLGRLLAVVYDKPICELLAGAGGLTRTRMNHLKKGLVMLEGFFVQTAGKASSITEPPPSTDINDVDFEMQRPGRPAPARVFYALAATPRDKARQRDRYSLACLRSLLQRAIEIFDLIDLAKEYKHLIPMVEFLSKPESRAVRFCDVLRSTQQADFPRELVAVLLNMETTGLLSSKVSEELHQKCPTLYGADDRSRHQADQLLTQAEETHTHKEQIRIAHRAKALYMKIAGKLAYNPGFVCKRYQSMLLFSDVIEIILACLDAVDTDSPEPNADLERIRELCFEPVASVLDELWLNRIPEWLIAACATDKTGRAEDYVRIHQEMSDTHREEERMIVMQTALQSKQRTFHEQFYEWFLANNMRQGLMEHCKAFDNPLYIEEYLAHASQEYLAEYYVMREDFAKAADCYARLAEQPATPGLTLERRVEEFMARAITCGKSARSFGEPLRELMEKMDVALIQVKIKRAMERPVPAFLQLDEESHRKRDEERAKLDDRLFDISELYNQYAKKFGLWECGLEIFKTCLHTDQTLIRRCWENIINEAFYEDLPVIQGRLAAIGRSLYPSEVLFQPPWLIAKLEAKSYEQQRPPGWVPELMRAIGVPFHVIFHAYASIFSSPVSNFPAHGSEDGAEQRLYFIQSIWGLVRSWVGQCGASEARFYRSEKVDLVLSEFVVDLATYRQREAHQLRAAIEQFRTAQLLPLLRNYL
eukprot:TRINITY_DN4128_c0_g1_i1.p1 TRINITY_DN4128_c0_g1~~TRINITY_DN4128_c0_g1_i1.p1  ORF type:complete len:1546 (-),score=226.07 TRINITY_DN4128_c0_g1_i1:1634-6271(-)